LTAVVAALVWVEVFVLDRGGAIASRLPFSTENGVFDTNALQKILLCWVLMAWLDRYDKQVRGYFAILADLSFGVFFLHMYFIQAWARFLPGENFPHGNLLKYFVLVAVVTGLSVLVILVVKRIVGKRSRMVVGS
jgi:peptidoglycan/LPS O-acetylase OafA/YrhL